MVDLNTLIAPSSGWVLQNAVAINDASFIVGTGSYIDDVQLEEAFLLTPNY